MVSSAVKKQAWPLGQQHLHHLGTLLEIQSLEPCLRLAKTETLLVKTTDPKQYLKEKIEKCFFVVALSIVNGNHHYV